MINVLKKHRIIKIFLVKQMGKQIQALINIIQPRSLQVNLNKRIVIYLHQKHLKLKQIYQCTNNLISRMQRE